MTTNDTMAPLMPQQTKCNQEIVGTLLFYSCRVDPILTCALNFTATKIQHGTQAVVEAIRQLLNYVAKHLNTIMHYAASDMILYIYSNTSFLFKQNSKSHVGSHYYLTSTNTTAPSNGDVHTLSAIIKYVVSSVAKAKLAAFFYDCKNAIPLCITLEEIGHRQ